MNCNLDKPSVSNNNFFNDHPVSMHFLSSLGEDYSSSGNNSPLPLLLNIRFALF